MIIFSIVVSVTISSNFDHQEIFVSKIFFLVEFFFVGGCFETFRLCFFLEGAVVKFWELEPHQLNFLSLHKSDLPRS